MTPQLLHGDAIVLMQSIPDESVDVVWADPPYFLSGGGTTCRSGKRASVDKGEWDRPTTTHGQLAWSRAWLEQAKRVLKPTGTAWVCGTMHSVHCTGFAMQSTGMRLLNEIEWVKPNPPPNLGCRCFTHSHETLLWASKGPKARHHFDYAWARAENGGKQMKDVWQFTAPGKSEKSFGGHPTQKPIALVVRCLMASCPDGGVVLDPFTGSGTTGCAVARCGRGIEFIGIERELEWVDVARERIAAE